jgi:hypothetical protein
VSGGRGSDRGRERNRSNKVKSVVLSGVICSCATVHSVIAELCVVLSLTAQHTECCK